MTAQIKFLILNIRVNYLIKIGSEKTPSGETTPFLGDTSHLQYTVVLIAAMTKSDPGVASEIASYRILGYPFTDAQVVSR